MSETSFDIFTEATMLPQLAELLNFFLDLLVGPKSKQLLVSVRGCLRFSSFLLSFLILRYSTEYH